MGLKLVGDNDTEEIKKQETKNPWDYEGMENKGESYSIKNSIQLDDDVPQDDEGGNVVFLINKILIYISLGLTVIAFIVICFLPQIDMYFNLFKIILLPYAFMAICFVDSILVNVLRKRNKKWSLVLVFMFFVVFYPIIRNKNVHGKSGLATVLVIGYIVSSIAWSICCYQGDVNYGLSAMMLPDQKVRTRVAALMDQTTESGTRLGKAINSNILVENVVMEVEEDEQFLVLEGIGFVVYDETSFYSSDTLSAYTTLVFWLNENGEYEIYNVALDGVPLPANKIETYMNIISMP